MSNEQQAAASEIETIESRVKEVIAENLGVVAADIKLENSLEDDLGADSLDAVELVMSLEDEFEIDVPDEHAEPWKTVGDVVKYFNEKAPK